MKLPKKLPDYLTRPNGIKRLYVVLPLAAAVVLLVFFFFLNTVISSIIHKKGEIPVPDVTNQTLMQALDILSEKNLGLKKEGVQYSESIPPNTIIKQIPRPGMLTRPGRMVRVIISYGGQFVFVPNLISLPVRTAEIEIRKSGLALGEENTMYSYAVSENTVISQEPQPGTSADKTTLVNLVVSLGPPPPGTVLMPNFLGKSVTEAELWIQKTGRKVDEIRYVPSQVLDENTVMKQTPSPDTILDDKVKIVLFVSIRDDGEEEPARQEKDR